MFKKFILTLMILTCILPAVAVIVNEPGPPVEEKDIKPQSYIPSKSEASKSALVKKDVPVKKNSNVNKANVNKALPRRK